MNHNRAHATSSIRTLQSAWTQGGTRLLAHRIAGRYRREMSTIRRKVRPLPLELVTDSRWSVCRSADEALALIAVHRPGLARDQANISALLDDGRAHMRTILDSSDETGQFSPLFDVETESALLIYVLCRLTRPSVVVETGVARGLSTSMILGAMYAEEVGHLHSFDTATEVAGLVPEDFKGRWTLWNLGGSRDPSLGLVEAMSTIGLCEIFLHDSDHSAHHQKFEYSLAQRFLTSQGFLLSDDVEGNDVMQQVCPPSSRLIALLDSRKAFGIAFRDEPEVSGEEVTPACCDR